MQVLNDVIQGIGNTPLIKLRQASEATGCTILGKAEFMNPDQSVKDRPARQMILEAEKTRRYPSGRPCRRGHRRQYRHRVSACRQRARLSHAHRHSQYTKPGKEGHAAARRRRTHRGAGRTIQ